MRRVALLFLLLPLAFAARPHVARAESCLEPREGMAPVNAEGVQLFYQEVGCGEPVVLMHGLTLDTRMWDIQYAMLAPLYRVIRYDARGHGRSDGILSPNLPVLPHEDLRGLLDTLGVESAHLVGHSVGGRVAIDFALTHPERVRSLVLVDSDLGGFPFPVGTTPPSFLDRALQVLFTELEFGLDVALPLWLADPLFAPANAIPLVQQRLEEMVLVGHAAQGEGAAATFENFLFNVLGADPPAVGRLDEITAPTLVLVGELDIPEFQDIANLLGSSIAGAEQHTVEGAGHMANMERPIAVSARLLLFLYQNSGSQ